MSGKEFYISGSRGGLPAASKWGGGGGLHQPAQWPWVRDQRPLKKF